MAYAQTPKIWGFALDGALEPMLERFFELMVEGRCDWVLIPVRDANTRTLKVPDGFRLKGASE